MLTKPLSPVRITHLSLALVGLMWVLPFLHDRHEYPLTTFDQEWWSALLGLLAMTAMLAGEYWRQPQVPRIALLPVALIGVVFAQLALGKIVYFEQALLYILYLLFALLLMLLGAWLRRSLGMERLALVLAIFLLVGAELSALIGVLQHFGWHTWLDSVIVRKISPSLYGNLAQPNHYANYIALGLVSLGLLYQQRKLQVGYVALLAVPLLFVLTLSGSRSSWLYLLLMAGLSLWAWYKERALRPVLRYSLALLLGFLLMHLAVQLPFLAGDGDTDSLRRFANSDTNGSIRLYLWHEAMLIFMQSPWVGVGFGQFAWHHFELLPELRPNNIAGLYNNAHNVIFQLAAETGLAGLLAFLATGGAWLYGLRLRETNTQSTSAKADRSRSVHLGAAYWWGYAATGVLFIHSLLEYPLWYAYFIAIFAFLLGMLDETHYRLEMRRVGRLSLLLILLLGLVTLLQVQLGYRQMKSTLAIQTAASGNTPANAKLTLDGLIGLRGSLLLSPYTDMFISTFTEISPPHIKDKLAFNGAVMRYIPTAETVYRQAYLLAQDGQLDAAKKLCEQAIWSYPANGNAHGLLMALAEKDPAHFSALLEFATQKEQEHARAVRNK